MLFRLPLFLHWCFSAKSASGDRPCASLADSSQGLAWWCWMQAFGACGLSNPTCVFCFLTTLLEIGGKQPCWPARLYWQCSYCCCLVVRFLYYCAVFLSGTVISRLTQRPCYTWGQLERFAQVQDASCFPWSRHTSDLKVRTQCCPGKCLGLRGLLGLVGPAWEPWSSHTSDLKVVTQGCPGRCLGLRGLCWNWLARRGQVIAVKSCYSRLPWQVLGLEGSVLGLVGPVWDSPGQVISIKSCYSRLPWGWGVCVGTGWPGVRQPWSSHIN